MIDKNFITAMAASVLLLFAYNYYYQARFGEYLVEKQEISAIKPEQEKSQSDPTPKVASSSSATETPPQSTSESRGPSSVNELELAGKNNDEPMAQKADTSEKLLVINTGVTTITLTNRGATPVGYILNKYHDSEQRDIDLHFDYDKRLAELSKEEDKPDLGKAKKYPLLGLAFGRAEFSDKINKAYYTASEGLDEVLVSDAPYLVSYRYRDGSGVEIIKKYTFRPNSYHFDFSITVLSTPEWGPFDYELVWFGLGDEPTDLASIYSYIGPIALANGNRLADAPDEDKKSISYKGDVPWVALTNRYFAAIGLPEKPDDQDVTTRYLDDLNHSIEWKLQATLTKEPVNFSFFLGPKLHSILGEYDNGIYSIIDYGWFDVIAKPLYWTMEYFYTQTGNWGWSIILLTILVKIIFFPLSQKGFKSMQKMQRVQPHLKRLQELYKDDKEKLNVAMMELYKEHKVNPLGGCLPMILQIPIFFALYKVLLESIEIKGAGFILWIEDMGQKDPYYITPVLMGVTMFIQQWMTPAVGDPTQRKVMMAMPVIFTFLFLSFPSGLVIYWLVNNILTIIQQWVIRRQDQQEAQN